VRYEDIAIYEQRYGKKSIYIAQQVFACAKDISGPLQYQVLEGKKERCKLCRISGKVKALQAETISNLEAGAASDDAGESSGIVLHMQCPQKQNKDDDTDFREWGKDVYDARQKDCVCLFWNLRQEARVDFKNSLAMAFEDKYPVIQGHTLVSPLRHTPSFF
jgi:hypothetical protein